jgi:DNA (cytosine-5)-methyltransferase 1
MVIGKIENNNNDKYSEHQYELKTMLSKKTNNVFTVKYIDLFCGLGAFHHAFNNNSNKECVYECVFACDIDENVRKIYETNYNIIPHGDINEIKINKIPDFDILCAGFPCQPFSIAGKKKGFEDDTKGNLFYSILKIIDKKNPKKIILENVKNLVSINNGKTFKKICDELEKRNYIVKYKIIDSKYYGSAQSRQRIFIICDKDNEFIFPTENKKNFTPLKTIIDRKEKTYINYNEKYELKSCKESKKFSSRMIYKLINKKTKKGGRQGERVYSINGCSPTICASSGGPGAKTGLYLVNGKIRRLNVKETIRLFGFNDDYIWDNIVSSEKMLYFLGNSIVVNVIDALIKNIII